MNATHGLSTTETELSVTDAAHLCRRSDNTIRQWVRVGRVKARRVLGRVFIDRASLDALLAGEPLGAAQDTSPAHPTPEGRP